MRRVEIRRNVDIHARLVRIEAKTTRARSGFRGQAGERLFDAGGASATSRKHNFDRHWRNLRTIFSHNPLRHKAKVIGDYVLNGVKTHLVEGRTF